MNKSYKRSKRRRSRRKKTYRLKTRKKQRAGSWSNANIAASRNNHSAPVSNNRLPSLSQIPWTVTVSSLNQEHNYTPNSKDNNNTKIGINATIADLLKAVGLGPDNIRSPYVNDRDLSNYHLTVVQDSGRIGVARLDLPVAHFVPFNLKLTYTPPPFMRNSHIGRSFQFNIGRSGGRKKQRGGCGICALPLFLI